MKKLAIAVIALIAFNLETVAQDNGNLMVEARLSGAKDWKSYQTSTIESLKGFVPKEQTSSTRYSRYGGLLAKRVKKTGYFYLAKIEGRWWLVDPEGCLFLSKGVDSVTPGNSKNNVEALKSRFQTEQNWAEQTAKLLLDKGFNTTGSWTNTSLLEKAPTKLPYTLIWNFMSGYGKALGKTSQEPGHTGYPNDAIFVFDPGFAAYCDEYAKQLIGSKNDPFLLGHFSDNELPFRDNALDNYLGLAKTEAGYQAAIKWLADRKKTISNIDDNDRRDFLEFVAERYFQITSQAIRKYDPNHLILGSRFHGRVLNYEAVFKAAGNYVDVISVNYYNRWTPEPDRIEQWTKWSGKPILVTEFYAKAMDAGLSNLTGAGWTVKTQKDRGSFYQNFTLGLLASKNCIGWHWFKYADNDPEDKTVDPSNQNSNKGIVTAKYVEYTTLLEAMSQVNSNAYSLIDFFDKHR